MVWGFKASRFSVDRALGLQGLSFRALGSSRVFGVGLGF